LAFLTLWFFLSFEKGQNEIWLLLAFFGQFDFYVDLANLKIILADFEALAGFQTLFLDTEC